MLKSRISLIFSLIFFIFGCKDEDTLPQSGTVDLSHYLAIGNSLTAGYSNNGLYREAQQYSYPNILAQQFALTTELDFNQPLMPEGNGSGYLEFISYNGFLPQIEIKNQDPNAFDKVNGPFNNLGIPGLRVKDIDLEEYGEIELNPFFHRIVPSGNESNTNYLDITSEQEPTFFTSWLGNNDLLGYALEGGVYGPRGQGMYGEGGLTDIILFKKNYEMLINSVYSNDTKGILLTIPDISLIPYFRIVTNELFPTFTDEKIEELNNAWEEHNSLVESHNVTIENDENLTEEEKQSMYREKIQFHIDQPNKFVIEDQNLPDLVSTEEELPKARYIKDGEYITLRGGQEILSNEAGIKTALGNRFVLTHYEVNLLDNYRSSYNNHIRYIAEQYGLEVIDTDYILSEFVNGKEVEGVMVSTAYVEGGLFSLDATHLTPRGYAIIANEIIEKMNESYSSSIPQVSIADYEALVED